ncbi:MAG TPA: hypothetical protein VKU35_01810 [Candidatus Limnocylindria bacterium]|nr:hypothetical protein [Candidatus Limnocylindria bacterium]
MLPSRHLRPAAAVLALGPVLAIALWAPVPHFGDRGAARVVAVVQERLPGWSVPRAVDIWEGGYAVVARCGSSRLGFQVIPGHGLPLDDAWLQPNDTFTRQQLQELSDYPAHLIWSSSSIAPRTLSCREELARIASGANGAEQASTSASDRNASSGIPYGQRPVE